MERNVAINSGKGFSEILTETKILSQGVHKLHCNIFAQIHFDCFSLISFVTEHLSVLYATTEASA